MNAHQLFKIIESSAESELLSLIYDGQQLILKIYHDEMECKIEIKIKTQFYFSNFISTRHTPCFLKINKITDELSIEHGVYIASSNFPDFMYQCRTGLHIAYGLRVSQFRYFFKILGACMVVVAIKNLSDIEIIF